MPATVGSVAARSACPPAREEAPRPALAPGEAARAPSKTAQPEQKFVGAEKVERSLSDLLPRSLFGPEFGRPSQPKGEESTSSSLGIAVGVETLAGVGNPAAVGPGGNVHPTADELSFPVEHEGRPAAVA